VLDTNLTSGFILACAVAPRMTAHGAGKVINIWSLMSEVGRSTISYYAAEGRAEDAHALDDC